MHLQDHKQISLGPPGQIDDLEHASLSPPGDVQDMWHVFWDGLGIGIGNYSDRAYEWLRGLGLTGSVEDMWKAYWENQLVNGGFDTDTDWTKGLGWTIAAGVATAAAATSDLTQTPVPALVTTETYRVTFTVTAFTAGTVTPVVGDTLGTARAALGTFTEDIVCGAGLDLDFRAAAFTGSIDNASIRRVS